MATLNPYLNFRDTAREVIEFYRSVFGGELTISTFGEFGMTEDPAEANRVMHSQLTTPAGFTIMAADTPNHMELPAAPTASAISISGSAEESAELHRYWDGLLDGGTISVPLERAPWGDEFGMLDDRFGISWLVNIGGAAA
ncbi:VOC family protein [Galbitalea sp. SE-J8]|uniref:VOC family protein n=1 Tax=Galbitalea sp. SE-J8 TaxID=3054952 RepID=UPI00259CFFBD|nr:VOC family protein [Galbitalea sp. SE-J8]MDM4764127.1 VOC family protein [Galbitalea sp. SE-J8]